MARQPPNSGPEAARDSAPGVRMGLVGRPPWAAAGPLAGLVIPIGAPQLIPYFGQTARQRAGQSGGAPALWSVAAQVLDRDRVPPRNVARRNAQGRAQALALQRAGSVVAAHDGL